MSRKQEVRTQFEDALKLDRYDTVTRLVYADWLEQYGDQPRDDDLAQEQRRRASPEWIEAARWMEDFAQKAGKHCLNYGEGYRQYLAETQGLTWSNPEHHQALEAAWQRLDANQNWITISLEDVIQWTLEFVKSEGDEVFTQYGSENLRDNYYEDKDQFWKNWEIVTGKTATTREGEWTSGPFSCSC